MTFLYKADPVRGAQWARLFAEKSAAYSISHLAGRHCPRGMPKRCVTSPYGKHRVISLRFSPISKWCFRWVRASTSSTCPAIPAHLPVVRMIEPGIVAGMVEYATLATLALHRDWLTLCRAATRRPLGGAARTHVASERRVGVLGLGVLGQAVLTRLASFGFQCPGLSRSPRILDGIECYAGAEALPAFLARTDVLVCLLPLTDATRHILNRDLFAQLPRGAALINTGRGGHLQQDHLLQALECGQLSAAVLDVADPEPLAADHPLWHHPRVMLTPHVASMTQPYSAVEVVLDNLRRHREGEPLIGLVDRARGY